MRFTVFTVALVALVSQSQAVNIEYTNHSGSVRRSLGAAQVIGNGIENVLDLVGLGKPDPNRKVMADIKAGKI